MAEEKKGFFARWLEKNAEKILQMIDTQLDEGEELEDWVYGQTAPNELLSWIPILDWIHSAGTKHYILCLTNKRFLAINTKGTSNKVKNTLAVPLSSVTSVEVSNRPLTAHLLVTMSNGKTTRYKELDREQAATFAGQYETLT